MGNLDAVQSKIQNHPKTALSWSGGKDSTMALYHAIRKGQPVHALLTNLSAQYDRISMHGVRRALLESQARALDLPLYTLEIPENASMEEYNERMQQQMRALKEEGFDTMLYGDIFLEDLKAYREKQMDQVGMKSGFPVWKRDTRELLQSFILLGFKALITCANARLLEESFAGRELDGSFLDALPTNVDPCGENGEFHTFVYDGPLFSEPVEFERGECVLRNYEGQDGDWDRTFRYMDLKPRTQPENQT